LGSTVRAIRESDHEKVISVVNEWWGGRDIPWLLPRLFFQHFGDTSFAVEEDGELVAFLIGFVSQSREGEAYIHFVEVRPDRRNKGGRQASLRAVLRRGGEQGLHEGELHHLAGQ
jgi:GNAT superfamily N-acetyltransferase